MIDVQSKTAAPVTADRLGQLLFILAVIALALAPTQLTIAVKGIPLHPAEPVLGLAALVWAVRWLRVRDTQSLPPLAHWVLVGAAALSVFAAAEAAAQGQAVSPKGAVVETAQLALYLLVAVTIFRAVFTTPARLRIAVIALLATTTLAVALGLAQRMSLSKHYTPEREQRTVYQHFTSRAYLITEAPGEVCSTFGSWNEHGFHASRTGYAGLLALVLPFALVLLAGTRQRGMAAWMSVLLLGAAMSLLAGYVLPALLLGLLVAGEAFSHRIGTRVFAGILLFIIAVALVGGITRRELLQEPYRLPVAEKTRVAEVGELKKFWGEQQAALNLFRTNALLGVGAGQYQAKINMAYGPLGSITDQRLEPDMQNGYLLTAATTGLIGLAALLLLFGSAMRSAWAVLRAKRGNGWAAGVLGALLALVLLTLVSVPWVRGTALVAALVLAMAGSAATYAAPARIIEMEDKPMRRLTRRGLQTVLMAIPALLVCGMLLAAPKYKTVIWEGEAVKAVSGKAFKVMNYKQDPQGKVSGEKVLAIPKLPAGEKVAEDEVTYKVNIPQTGVYYLWARCYWSTGCGNSFFYKVEGNKYAYVLGGDATYDSLHWISLSDDGGRPRPLRLEKGTVTFTLGAKESGARVDQFLLTTDAKKQPAGVYAPTKDAVKLN